MRILKVLPMILLLALSLSGCGLTLDNANQTATSAQHAYPVAADGWAKILQAIDNNNQKVKSFVVKEEMKTVAQNVGHDYSIYGDVILPDQFAVSMNLDGQSYYYVQTNTETYLRDEGIWRKADRIQAPALWSTFAKLTQSKPPVVYKLPDSILISSPVEVYQFEGLASDYADSLIRNEHANLPARYTFYIDKKDRVLKKVEIQSYAGQQQVGTVLNDFSVEYSSLNSKDVTVKVPDIKPEK